jgi:hypothetical protein
MHWLLDVALEMGPEDGCLTVYDAYECSRRATELPVAQKALCQDGPSQESYISSNAMSSIPPPPTEAGTRSAPSEMRTAGFITIRDYLLTGVFAHLPILANPARALAPSLLARDVTFPASCLTGPVHGAGQVGETLEGFASVPRS